MATISPRAAAGVLLRPFRPVAPPHQWTGQISSCSLNFFQGRRRKGGHSPCPRPRHPSIFLRRRLRVGDLWVSYGSREPSPGESGLEDRDPLPAEDVPFPEVHDPSVVGRDAADGEELGWLPAFPHALTASMANFLFGYHIGVMNGPIESIAKELGFEGNTFLQGLVVSIFIAGAFIGSISCGSLVGSLGCRRTLQIDTIPLIVGALLSAQAHSVDEILWGRFLVGLGIGVNTVLVPIYISEVERDAIHCKSSWIISYIWNAICC